MNKFTRDETEIIRYLVRHSLAGGGINEAEQVRQQRLWRRSPEEYNVISEEGPRGGAGEAATSVGDVSSTHAIPHAIPGKHG